MRNLFLILIATIILLGGSIFLFKTVLDKPVQTSQESVPTLTVVSKSPEKQITLAEISKHKTSTDCWFAIEGNVYDVTQFIASNQHPGGKDIIAGCGKDATVLFNKRPEDNKPHSDLARSMLPGFQIGILVK
jgi:cytochrome b involved in lipid metabolism